MRGERFAFAPLFVSEKLLAEAGSVPRMNYFGTFSGEHARSKIRRITFASFIYKGRQRYSQEEKSSVAFATEAQRKSVERFVKIPPMKCEQRRISSFAQQPDCRQHVRVQVSLTDDYFT